MRCCFLDFFMAKVELQAFHEKSTEIMEKSQYLPVVFNLSLQFTFSCCLGHILLVAVSRPLTHSSDTPTVHEHEVKGQSAGMS